MAIVGCGLATSFSNAGERGPKAARTPVIVELFTSEGCSSCPPADEALGKLASEQPVAGAEIIPLALHVDYWNNLGWADPFSSAKFSERQNEYAAAFRSSRIYTPQMIVDGRTEFVGSQLAKAKLEISAAAKNPKARIDFKAERAASKPNELLLALKISGIQEAAGGENVEVWLAVTESGLKTAVPKGENAGRTLTHSGVARELTKLQTVDPQKSDVFEAAPILKLDPKWDRRQSRAVVFLQKQSSRAIIGAASVAIAN